MKSLFKCQYIYSSETSHEIFPILFLYAHTYVYIHVHIKRCFIHIEGQERLYYFTYNTYINIHINLNTKCDSANLEYQL